MMRSINKIILHCTATKEGKDFKAKDIDRWHKAQGWKCIGYHYVVDLDGSIESGRPEIQVGAHCAGYNSHSIGVVYVGGLSEDGKPKDTRTKEQKEALVKIVNELLKKYPKAAVYGHNELSKKACPCFDVKKEFREKSPVAE